MIVGRSEALLRGLALAERYAPTRLPILLLGETGTGKEEFARHMHALSGRRGALVDVNCAALPRDIVESLLFGHRRGAFTGAVEATTGFVARADRGTLFLDELGSFPPESQAKLLRVLETGEVPTLGADTLRMVDVRVVAAAQQSLVVAVRAGLFRPDLFERLAGVVIELPRLVDRLEDVVPIAEHFAAAVGKTLEPDVRAVLERYAWPGNVRELRFVIERATHLVPDGTLSAAAVAEAITLGAPRASTAWRSRRVELGDVLAAGPMNAWHAERMARALRIGRTTLFRILNAAGLTLSRAREYHEYRYGTGTGGTPDRGSRSLPRLSC